MRNGPLLTDYRGAGPVHVLDGCDPQSRAVADLLIQLKARGFQTVISNTTASGRFVPIFKAAGFKVVSLVHELPHVLQTYESRGLMQDARCLATGSDKIVFAGKLVADGFQKYTEHQLSNAVIRPQGLYNATGSERKRKLVRPVLCCGSASDYNPTRGSYSGWDSAITERASIYSSRLASR